MILKLLLGFICSSILLVPVFAQDGQAKLSTAGAPSLQIVSAPIKLDREKRKVSLSLEVKNTGAKTIKAFGWQYRTQGILKGYNVSSAADMPEVSVVLPLNMKKKVLLRKESDVPESFWNLPIREIRIVSITFEDGSSWRRTKDD
jgi:hypothetical protein